MAAAFILFMYFLILAVGLIFSRSLSPTNFIILAFTFTDFGILLSFAAMKDSRMTAAEFNCFLRHSSSAFYFCFAVWFNLEVHQSLYILYFLICYFLLSVLLLTYIFTLIPSSSTYGFIDFFINTAGCYLTDLLPKEHYGASLFTSYLCILAIVYRNLFPDVVFFLSENSVSSEDNTSRGQSLS